jgi:hypothetical protein
MLVSPQVQIRQHHGVQCAGIRLRCPQCFGAIGYLQDEDATPLDCLICGFRLAREQGIWKALLPEATARYATFVKNYESIRAAEVRPPATTSGYLIKIFPAFIPPNGHSVRAPSATSSRRFCPVSPPWHKTSFTFWTWARVTVG